MVNLHLIDFNVVSNVDSKYAFVPSATVRCLSLPPEQFCSMYSQLNGAQKYFFSFIFKYIYIYTSIHIYTYTYTYHTCTNYAIKLKLYKVYKLGVDDIYKKTI